MPTTLSCSRWFWEILPIFCNCIIGPDSATDSFPSRVPCLRFQRIWSVVVPYSVNSVLFTLLTFYIGYEHLLGIFVEIYGGCKLQDGFYVYRLAPIWLLGIEQCPSRCLVWVSLCLITMVDMVDSFERKLIEVTYHHEREWQHTILWKGCVHFSAMIQFH